MRTLKVYLIYLDPTSYNPENKGKDWDLYGITNEKNIYKRFIESRKMKLFKTSKQKMTPDQYQKLTREYRESVLQVTTFSTKGKYPKNIMGTYKRSIKDIKVITTFLEYQSVKDSIDNPFTMLEDIGMINPLLFKSSIRELLNRIRYDQMYKMVLLPYMGTDSFMVTSEENLKDSDMSYEDRIFVIQSDDLGLPDLWVDELMMFIKLFGHLLEFKE